MGRLAPATAGAAPVNGRILFLRCGNSCQIYTANPDGTAIDRVTSDGDSFDGDWSPDGTKIVYASTRSGDVTIWISRRRIARAAAHAKRSQDRRVLAPLRPRRTTDPVHELRGRGL
jgi:hypothetical protein